MLVVGFQVLFVWVAVSTALQDTVCVPLPKRLAGWGQKGTHTQSTRTHRSTLAYPHMSCIVRQVNAAATFNILNMEARKVAGAFLPLAAAGDE